MKIQLTGGVIMNIRRGTLNDLPALIDLRINCLRAMDGLTDEQEAFLQENKITK